MSKKPKKDAVCLHCEILATIFAKTNSAMIEDILNALADAAAEFLAAGPDEDQCRMAVFEFAKNVCALTKERWDSGNHVGKVHNVITIEKPTDAVH